MKLNSPRWLRAGEVEKMRAAALTTPPPKPLRESVLDETSELFCADADVQSLLDDFARELISVNELGERMAAQLVFARQRAERKVLGPALLDDPQGRVFDGEDEPREGGWRSA